MAGFLSTDAIVAALTAGQTKRVDWCKLMNPTAAAVANEWHTLFRGDGNPPADAIFNAGSALVFQPVTESTTSAGCLQIGGNVSPMYKFILNGSAVTAAATCVPCTLALVDVVGFYRVTDVTNTGAQVCTNTLSAFSTFTADASDVLTHTNINLMTGTRVRLTTSAADLPDPLQIATDYYVIKLTDLTCKLSDTYAHAIAGTDILNITDGGTGTHTINTLLPRYTNGAGLNVMEFVNNGAANLGAVTPNLSLVYTNAAQVGSRATPLVLPVGKTADKSCHILYTGATAAGKYNYAMPLQAGDTGVAEIYSIRHSTNYATSEYSVALYKELARFPLSTLGLMAERNFLFEMPSLPRIYDGAALYWVIGSGVATPTNSAFSGHLDFVWG